MPAKRTSIGDLMKLVGMESSLAERKELAKELGYTGNTQDSATMNVWQHKQVMRKLAENGGKVPATLLDSSSVEARPHHIYGRRIYEGLHRRH